MSKAEQLVIEAARQLVYGLRAKREAGDATLNDLIIEAHAMTLAMAVRAYDRAERGRLRDADLGDQCCCPDHRYE